MKTGYLQEGAPPSIKKLMLHHKRHLLASNIPRDTYTLNIYGNTILAIRILSRTKYDKRMKDDLRGEG